MNKRDTKKIIKLMDKMRRDLMDSMDEILSVVTDSADRMEEKFYDRSDNWQESERGSELMERIEEIRELETTGSDLLSDFDEGLENFCAELQQ